VGTGTGLRRTRRLTIALHNLPSVSVFAALAKDKALAWAREIGGNVRVEETNGIRGHAPGLFP